MSQKLSLLHLPTEQNYPTNVCKPLEVWIHLKGSFTMIIRIQVTKPNWSLSSSNPQWGRLNTNAGNSASLLHSQSGYSKKSLHVKIMPNNIRGSKKKNTRVASKDLKATLELSNVIVYEPSGKHWTGMVCMARQQGRSQYSPKTTHLPVWCFASKQHG